MNKAGLDKTERILLYLILLCTIPAFFLNLGIQTLNEDEAIRSLVAFEMLYNNNFIVPTLNGEPYYYKPPLYNWFIALSYTLTGQINEFTSRLPTILFLGIFGFTIFKANRQYLSQRQSILIAFAYLTCGRILFWDSFLAYIDIAYSWISFLVIFLSYHYYSKGKYLHFFLIPAILTGLGYLMKGFPSFLFYFGSIGIILLLKKDLKKLYKGPGFILSLLVMATMIGSYYWLYNQYHDFSNSIGPLLDQSTRRTIFKFGITDVIKHIFIYPLENIYHFFPFTLLGFLLFKTSLRKKVFEQDYLKFMFILFIINIMAYWVSPEVYPRYILMLIPLSLSIIIYLTEEAQKSHPKLRSIIFWFLMTVPFIGLLGAVLGWFHPGIKYAPMPYLVLSILAITFICIGLFAYKKPEYILWFTILSLLITRIGFNWFVIPERHDGGEGTQAKLEILDIQRKYNDKPLRLYKRSIMDKTSSFYLATKNGEPNQIVTEITDEFYYILDTLRVKDVIPNIVKIDSFYLREFDRTCYVVKKK